VPRVPVHTLDDAPDASQPLMEALGARSGTVINIFGAMAHAPALLASYAALEEVLREQSSLGEPVRQAIHLTVANVNDCGYCQSAYTGTARAAGHSLEDTVAIRRGEVPGDERLTALLQVCRQVAAHTGYVDDDTWQAALDAGWTTAELLEAYGDVVRTILTNYLNHLVGTELDLRPAPPLD
jgi:AhpD family alkylhydroperoxidase